MEVNHVALLITENLHLDVLGTADITLQENSRVAKRPLRFALSLFKKRNEIFRVFNHPHAAATAPKGSLDDERKADFFGNLGGLSRIRYGVLGTRKGRDFGLIGNFAGFDLITHPAEEFGAGADKSETVFLAGAGETGIFGKKAVAGVN